VALAAPLTRVRIRFWGTRGSIAKPGPSTLRHGGNTSCVEARTADGTLIVLDCGTGALRDVPVVMISGFSAAEDTAAGATARRHHKSSGASDALEAPVSIVARPPTRWLRVAPDHVPSHHRTTSSARASSDCGIASPSAFAVLRLTTKSNFLGCSTGRSAGFAPFRILPTRRAVCRHVSGRDGP
jgi:hypothetical protein